MQPDDSLQRSYRVQGLINRWAGHILVVGMLVCLAGVAGGLFSRLVPYWNSNFLPWFAALVTVESMLSEYRARRSVDLEMSIGGYLFIEWITILLALRIFSYLNSGFGGFLDAFQQLALGFQEGTFFERLVDIPFMLSLLPIIAVWTLARSYAADLRALQNEEVLIEIEGNAVVSNRGEIRMQITSRFLMIGTLMVILSGAATMDFTPDSLVPPSSFPMDPGQQVGGYWLLAYFIQGLFLLSLAHQSALRAAWAWERIPIDDNIAIRWIGISVLLVGLVVLVALLLPASYTFGLSATLNYLLGWLVTGIYALLFLILFPLFILISQFMRLIGMTPTDFLPQPTPPLPPPSTTEESPMSDWVGLLQSAVFWILLIGIVLYALIMYVRQNKALMSVFKRVGGWHLVMQAVQWLRERFRGARRTVGGLVNISRQRVKDLLRRAQANPLGMPSLRLRSLDSRQQVRFYYLALLRRGAEVGYPRQPSETPAEYAQTLTESLEHDSLLPGSTSAEKAIKPSPSADIDDLTGAFSEARYSLHTIKPDHAHLARQAWNHLRQRLREDAKKRQKNG